MHVFQDGAHGEAASISKQQHACLTQQQGSQAHQVNGSCSSSSKQLAAAAASSAVVNGTSKMTVGGGVTNGVNNLEAPTINEDLYSRQL